MVNFMGYWMIGIAVVILVIIACQVIQEIYGFIVDSDKSQSNIILKFMWGKYDPANGIHQPYNTLAGGEIMFTLIVFLFLVGGMIDITISYPIILFSLYGCIALIFGARYVVRISTKLNKIGGDI